MIDKIKVSVIVPAYNSEKTIYKCIDSILNQTLKEIEVIVINDGSLDKTLEMLKEMKDERLIIIDKKNEGVSEARNDALKIANGKYILNVDSDDWISEEFCKEMYSKAEMDNLDIVISDFFYEFQNKIVYTQDLNISNTKILSGYEYLEIFLKENFHGYNWNKLIRKKLYTDIYYDKNISMMEDVLVLVNLAINSKRIGKINKAYYYYVQTQNNVTNNITANHLKSVFLVFDKIEKILIHQKLKQLLKSRQKYSILQFILKYTNDESEKYDIFIEKYLELFKGKTVELGGSTQKINFILKTIEITKSKNIVLIWKKIFEVRKNIGGKFEKYRNINISLSK